MGGRVQLARFYHACVVRVCCGCAWTGSYFGRFGGLGARHGRSGNGPVCRTTGFHQLAFQRERRARVGCSIVVPICGTRGCVRGYIYSLLRDTPTNGARVVLIGSNSTSSDTGVYRELDRRGSYIGFVGGDRNNTTSTQGTKLRPTYKRFVLFYSTSSCITPSCFGRVRGFGGRSLIIFNCATICRRSVSFHRVPRGVLEYNSSFRGLTTLCGDQQLCRLCAGEFGHDVVTRGRVCFRRRLPVYRSVGFYLRCTLYYGDVTTGGTPLCFCGHAGGGSIVRDHGAKLTGLFPGTFNVTTSSVRGDDLDTTRGQRLLRAADQLCAMDFVAYIDRRFGSTSISPHRVGEQARNVYERFGLVDFNNREPHKVLYTKVHVYIGLQLHATICLLIGTREGGATPGRGWV